MRTIQSKIQLLLLLFPLFLTGCEEEEVLSENFTHYYYQSYCADAWQPLTANVDLQTAVTTYLADQGIAVLAFREVDDPARRSGCKACSCTSGKTIEIRVSTPDGTKLVELPDTGSLKWFAF